MDARELPLNLARGANRDGFAPNGPGRVLSSRSQRPLVVAVSSQEGAATEGSVKNGRPAQVTVESSRISIRSSYALAPAPGRFVFPGPF